jgi:basic amino acid/polyamine antiporter, APA family
MSARDVGEGPALVRAIGRWDLTAAVINGIIGVGVFGLPSTLAALTGAWSPLAFVAGGVAVLAIILAFAEVASRFDQAGGPYLYTRTAFGAFTGFQVGWLHIWTRLLSAAAILNVFVAYAAAFFPWLTTPTGRAIAMAALVAVATVVNIVGVRQATWTVDLFTVAKLLPLVLLIAVGATAFRPEIASEQAVTPPQWGEALVLAMFAYGGFESSLIAGSETRNPRRDTAFALGAAILLISAVYVALQAVVVGVLPGAASNTAPVAATLEVLLGRFGAVIGVIGALVSVSGWIAGFCMMTPRIGYAMATRGELPRALGLVHPRFRTPYVAIGLNSLVALGLGVYGTFTGAATLSVVTRLGIYILTCAALPVLRRREGPSPGYVAPAGVAVSVAAIGYCLWLFTTRTLNDFTLLLGIMVIGTVLWLIARRQSPRARS